MIQELNKELDTHEEKRKAWDDAVASVSDWLAKNGEDELAAQIVDLFEVKGRVVASLFSQYENRIMEAERAGVSRRERELKIISNAVYELELVDRYTCHRIASSLLDRWDKNGYPLEKSHEEKYT